MNFVRIGKHLINLERVDLINFHDLGTFFDEQSRYVIKVFFNSEDDHLSIFYSRREEFDDVKKELQEILLQ